MWQTKSPLRFAIRLCKSVTLHSSAVHVFYGLWNLQHHLIDQPIPANKSFNSLNLVRGSHLCHSIFYLLTAWCSFFTFFICPRYPPSSIHSSFFPHRERENLSLQPVAQQQKGLKRSNRPDKLREYSLSLRLIPLACPLTSFNPKFFLHSFNSSSSSLSLSSVPYISSHSVSSNCPVVVVSSEWPLRPITTWTLFILSTA